MKISSLLPVLVLIFFLFPGSAFPQYEGAQIPPSLNNTFFEVNTGAIFYGFSPVHAEPGFTIKSVKIPHAALRFVPAGYQFNRYLSAQLTYMRPVLWVHYIYDNGNGSDIERAVWMNVAGVTIKPWLPLNNGFSLYGEGGMAIVTRKGFQDELGRFVVANANYISYALGAGIKYNLSDKWALQLGGAWTPANSKAKQPSISFLSVGFTNRLVPFSDDKVNRTKSTAYIHHKQVLQVSLTSNLAGYGVNDFFAEGTVPVFWGGEAKVGRGVSVNYVRNIFHGTKIFFFDWGAGIGIWESYLKQEKFITLSVYPVLGFTFLRSRPLDLYFLYTLAGPAFISEKIIDDKELGEKFTFQDNMGLGLFAGKQRNFNMELKIGHYSNGDIFPGNEGVKIPLSLGLGYSF